MPKTYDVKYDVTYALSCKLGGFVTLRNNELKNITADLLSKVCYHGCVELMLQELTGEQSKERAANRTDEARLDVTAVNFCVAGQRAFFYIRVFDLNARRYSNLELAKCYSIIQYDERVLNIENGSFIPLVYKMR